MKNDKWIPVAERLPRVGQVALIFFVTRQPEYFYTNNEVMTGFMNGEGSWTGFFGAGRFEIEYPVTHWQPLPEPPEDE